MNNLFEQARELERLVGNIIDVKIIDCKTFYLMGEVI